METLYASEVTSQGGLHGHIKSEDGSLDTDVYMPTGEKSDKDKGTTPEQLFAASYASCLEGTIYHVAKLNNVEINDTKVIAKVQAVEVEKGDLQFKLDLEVEMPNIDHAKAQHLLNEAYKNCPLTKATQGNMEVNLSLN
uniref:Ohr family peroxiredoxin n=1 Tax=Roseihalotalea indica TaxID=2867963 RepID=A0AA49JFQ8_9BACT|nr:Ohr family peroxiredoxin [Tunicatimonas sp. TK19036]